MYFFTLFLKVIIYLLYLKNIFSLKVIVIDKNLPVKLYVVFIHRFEYEIEKENM